MLSLLRFSPKTSPTSIRCIQPRLRTYARVAETSSHESPVAEDKAIALLPSEDSSTDISLTPAPRLPAKYNVQVKEDHGLYAFFRKEVDDLGKVSYHTVEPPEGDALFPSGRAWKAGELRLKSFQDLHTLWYIVLRERNLLASQREEARRMGIQNPSAWSSTKKAALCRKTMARIKYVLNERRLAYEGAVKLVEAEKEEVESLKEDEKVLKYQLQEWRKGRELRKQRRRRQSPATVDAATSVLPDGTDSSAQSSESSPSQVEAQTSSLEKSVPPPSTVEASSPSPSTTEPTTTKESSPEVVAQPVEAASKPRTRSERRVQRQKEEAEQTLAAKDAPEGIDAAESSLFGGPIQDSKKKP